MTTPRSAWIWYLVGALLTLAWKFVRYIREEKKKGTPTYDAVMEYIFEDTVANSTSWCTTIALVWVGGSVFIDLRDNAGVFAWVKDVPLHNSLAFALGGIMELAAPCAARNFVNWLISKLPGGGVK